MQVRIPAAFLVCSADLLTRLSRADEPSGNFPEAVSLNSIFYLFEPDQTSSFTYAVIFFSLRSRILRLTEPYPSACIVISFKILSRLVSFTQPFALALTGRLAGCYYILSIARDQEHWVLLSILEPHAKVLYNINKRSPRTCRLSTDFLEYSQSMIGISYFLKYLPTTGRLFNGKSFFKR